MYVMQRLQLTAVKAIAKKYSERKYRLNVSCRQHYSDLMAGHKKCQLSVYEIGENHREVEFVEIACWHEGDEDKRAPANVSAELINYIITLGYKVTRIGFGYNEAIVELRPNENTRTGDDEFKLDTV